MKIEYFETHITTGALLRIKRNHNSGAKTEKAVYSFIRYTHCSQCKRLDCPGMIKLQRIDNKQTTVACFRNAKRSNIRLVFDPPPVSLPDELFEI